MLFSRHLWKGKKKKVKFSLLLFVLPILIHCSQRCGVYGGREPMTQEEGYEIHTQHKYTKTIGMNKLGILS